MADAGPALSEELLVDAARIAADDGHGRVQDVLGGAVVLFEQDGARLGEILQEALDVAIIGATPAVDGLIGVAHREQIAMGQGQAAHQAVLRGIRVLKLVDQNVLEVFLVARQELGMFVEQVAPRAAADHRNPPRDWRPAIPDSVYTPAPRCAPRASCR